MARTSTSIAKEATRHAREVSENGMVFVYERDGVYWLALGAGNGDYRTLQAVGIARSGICRIREEISTYFESK